MYALASERKGRRYSCWCLPLVPMHVSKYNCTRAGMLSNPSCLAALRPFSRTYPRLQRAALTFQRSPVRLQTRHTFVARLADAALALLLRTR